MAITLVTRFMVPGTSNARGKVDSTHLDSIFDGAEGTMYKRVRKDANGAQRWHYKCQGDTNYGYKLLGTGHNLCLASAFINLKNGTPAGNAYNGISFMGLQISGSPWFMYWGVGCCALSSHLRAMVDCASGGGDDVAFGSDLTPNSWLWMGVAWYYHAGYMDIKTFMKPISGGTLESGGFTNTNANGHDPKDCRLSFGPYRCNSGIDNATKVLIYDPCLFTLDASNFSDITDIPIDANGVHGHLSLPVTEKQKYYFDPEGSTDSDALTPATACSDGKSFVEDVQMAPVVAYEIDGSDTFYVKSSVTKPLDLPIPLAAFYCAANWAAVVNATNFSKSPTTILPAPGTAKFYLNGKRRIDPSEISKTGGYTNVYQIDDVNPYTANVVETILFEGQTNAEWAVHYCPWQANLADVEANEGSYTIDSGKIYFHPKGHSLTGNIYRVSYKHWGFGYADDPSIAYGQFWHMENFHLDAAPCRITYNGYGLRDSNGNSHGAAFKTRITGFELLQCGYHTWSVNENIPNGSEVMLQGKADQTRPYDGSGGGALHTPDSSDGSVVLDISVTMEFGFGSYTDPKGQHTNPYSGQYTVPHSCHGTGRRWRLFIHDYANDGPGLGTSWMNPVGTDGSSAKSIHVARMRSATANPPSRALNAGAVESITITESYLNGGTLTLNANYTTPYYLVNGELTITDNVATWTAAQASLNHVRSVLQRNVGPEWINVSEDQNFTITSPGVYRVLYTDGKSEVASPSVTVAYASYMQALIAAGII